MLIDDCKVTAEKLSWKCDSELLPFQTTEDLPELDGSIGQERALKSINFGLGMVESGFNLYLAGETGTGRTSSIMNILKKRARNEPPPLDWCYVYNFKNPDNPISLSLQVGMGRQLEQDMRELLVAVKNDIPKALQSKVRAFQK